MIIFWMFWFSEKDSVFVAFREPLKGPIDLYDLLVEFAVGLLCRLQLTDGGGNGSDQLKKVPSSR